MTQIGTNSDGFGGVSEVFDEIGAPVLVAFGSNLGRSDENIREARRFLGATPGVRIVRESSIWRSFPVGGPVGQPIFSNAVDLLATTLEPIALLRATQEIERKLRRVRKEFWGPRTIDLDLILFGDLEIESSELTIPHPRTVWRDFVLGPACEVAPEATLPTTGLTLREHRRLLFWNFENFDAFSYWTRVDAERSLTQDGKRTHF